MIPEIIVAILVLLILFRTHYLAEQWRRYRHVVADRNAPAIDYYKIARLEIELFGETRPNVDSPIKAGLANVYGVTDDGHIDGRCNVNSSIGPVCRNKWHTGRRVQPSPGDAMAQVLRTAITGINPTRNPVGDHSYDDPDWTDEDGRPW